MNDNQHLKNLELKIDALLNVDKSETGRLSRIESKLEQLADAVVSLARAEEKISNLMADSEELKSDINSINAKMANNNVRVTSIETRVTKCETDNETLSKFFWLILTGLLTFAGSMIIMLFKGNNI